MFLIFIDSISSSDFIIVPLYCYIVVVVISLFYCSTANMADVSFLLVIASAAVGLTGKIPLQPAGSYGYSSDYQTTTAPSAYYTTAAPYTTTTAASYYYSPPVYTTTAAPSYYADTK